MTTIFRDNYLDIHRWVHHVGHDLPFVVVFKVRATEDLFRFGVDPDVPHGLMSVSSVLKYC